MGEFEDQIALQGSFSSRPESPALEGAASKAVEEAQDARVETAELGLR